MLLTISVEQEKSCFKIMRKLNPIIKDDVTHNEQLINLLYLTFINCLLIVLKHTNMQPTCPSDDLISSNKIIPMHEKQRQERAKVKNPTILCFKILITLSHIIIVQRKLRPPSSWVSLNRPRLNFERYVQTSTDLRRRQTCV